MGPYRALWPGQHRKSKPLSSIFMGTSPAPWAPSTQTFIPYWWARAVTRSTGTRIPNTLEAMVQATSRVLGPMARRKWSRVASLSPGTTWAAVQATPRASRALRGRITALCSKSETTTWSPGFKKPLSTRLRAWVQLGWKKTHSGPGAPKNSAACTRSP